MHVLCGVGTKVMHTATDNIAYILFYSDLSVVKIGFNITFTSIEGTRAILKVFEVFVDMCVFLGISVCHVQALL